MVGVDVKPGNCRCRMVTLIHLSPWSRLYNCRPPELTKELSKHSCDGIMECFAIGVSECAELTDDDRLFERGEDGVDR